VALIAVTYIYFLIFAQFAFLKRLASLGIDGTPLKIVMAAMAIGGILFSLLVPRINIVSSPNLRLRIGLCASGAAAFFTLLPLGIASAAVVSFLIGAALGLVTVTLAANLRQWIGDRNALLKVGLGTGIGYFACNFPPLFTASPQVQAATAGVLCLAACCLPLRSITELQDQAPLTSQSPFPFLRILAAFGALVWLDSAAFLIIQNTPSLKAGTWQGSAHLWTNAVLHLVAALGSAFLLRARGLSTVLFCAFGALAGACLLLLSPDRALFASVLYPIGVSLYSVALIAYPSLLSSLSTAERGRRAGWIYAVAGWSASVLGIGMAQNLGYVPPAFVLGAAAFILSPWLLTFFLHRKRELAVTTAVVLSAFCVHRILRPARSTSPLSQIERGRQVYISEGCIGCHSQYVRPNTADVLMWGPVESMQELRLQRPPLIGNRRQGPDLSNVGVRRSALWLKAHFYSPAEVSGASIMPSFSILFRDRRGDDLVAYLSSLHGANAQQHIAQESHWQPSDTALREADSSDGQRLYGRYCATCHTPNGRTLEAWQSSFRNIPTDLTRNPLQAVPASASRQEQLIHLAKITKFGIPATDMPGHEYLPDQQIASISLWVLQNSAPPTQSR
jgi:cytochrome c oxidase cbb3-type subunit 2